MQDSRRTFLTCPLLFSSACQCWTTCAPSIPSWCSKRSRRSPADHCVACTPSTATARAARPPLCPNRHLSASWSDCLALPTVRKQRAERRQILRSSLPVLATSSPSSSRRSHSSPKRSRRASGTRIRCQPPGSFSDRCSRGSAAAPSSTRGCADLSAAIAARMPRSRRRRWLALQSATRSSRSSGFDPCCAGLAVVPEPEAPPTPSSGPPSESGLVSVTPWERSLPWPRPLQRVETRGRFSC
eukprot:scaffold134_cov244-Pinguiococcus_pyrenoidosus.AAC.6